MKLTNKNIQYMEFGKDTVVFDDVVRSFGLRVRESGSKSYVLHYRWEGRAKKITLGSVEYMSLQEARELARRVKLGVRNGVNPIDARRGYTEGGKIKDFLAAYLERHSERHKASSREDKRRIENTIIPEIGELQLAAITRNDIDRFHQQLSRKAPYEANRCIELLRHAFKMAVLWEYIKENPVHDIKPNKEVSRDRFLNDEEFRRVWHECTQEKNLYAAAAIKFLMTTGMRKNEALQAKWDDVYFDDAEIRITQKGGKKRYFPLNKLALEVLESIPPTVSNPYIFCGGRKGKPLADVRSTWNRIRVKAKVKDVRIHDLRRTAASKLLQAGINVEYIQKLLGHTNLRATKIYARVTGKEARKASDEHEKLIKKLTLDEPEEEST